MAMNITLVTYGQSVDFGIIACRRSMPQVQRTIDYMEDALVELEDAAGLSNTPEIPRGRPTRKAKARPKAKSKAKPKAKSKIKAKPKARTRGKAAK